MKSQNSISYHKVGRAIEFPPRPLYVMQWLAHWAANTEVRGSNFTTTGLIFIFNIFSNGKNYELQSLKMKNYTSYYNSIDNLLLPLLLLMMIARSNFNNLRIEIV